MTREFPLPPLSFILYVPVVSARESAMKHECSKLLVVFFGGGVVFEYTKHVFSRHVFLRQVTS